ncbi:globin domain-containing protein [Emticicia sp. SJ17W-69]|uniref:globin domain-containing protein n=1 Tax=Emticicia sp. SJ17W-69 TaxID=3421657 RepID=UPI003EC124A0
MTKEEIKIIKSTWRSLQGLDATLLGDVFYSRLFLDEPSLKKMFKISQQEQAKKLIDMLDLIVQRLDRLGELSDEIKAMAERHVGYGAKPKHYDQVGKALLWTLEKGLGKDWKPEVAAAWTKCYGILAGAMLQTTA